MPEIPQYLFTHKELAELLVKAAGVHEGRWALAIQMGVAGGSFGSSAEEMSPGMAMTVHRVVIQRLVENLPLPPESLIVDAAQVNPANNKAKNA